MRRTLLVTSVLILSLAACSSSAKTDQATTSTTRGATLPQSTPTAPITSPAPPVTISAFVLAVDLKSQTLTVDPMAFLTGAAAKTAFQHDHPDAQEGPPNDYYISDPQKDRVELKFPATATVRLVHVGGTDHTQPVAVPQTALVGYQSLSLRPFSITERAGTVQAVVERFVP